MTTDLPPPAGALPPTSRRPEEARWIVVLGVAVTVVFTAVVLMVARLRTDGTPRVRLFDPSSSQFSGFALPEPFAAAPIDLATADGGRFQLADARGKAVLIFFGYTRCPDVCPQTLAKLSAALAELGDGAEDVTTVFVTVDPSHDTADVVRRYLTDHDPRIVGLVGAEAEIASLAASYDVAYGPAPTPAPGLMPPGASDGHGDHDASSAWPATAGSAATLAADATPELAHSSTVFLIDPAGRLRVVLGAEASPRDIAHDVRAVLRSSE